LDGVATTCITSGSAGVPDAVGGAVAVFVAGGVAAAAGAAGALLPDMRYVLKPSLHTSKEQSHGFCGSQGVCCRSQCHSVKHDTTADSAACCAMVIEWLHWSTGWHPSMAGFRAMAGCAKDSQVLLGAVAGMLLSVHC
jgi:hypothetical protein